MTGYEVFCEICGKGYDERDRTNVTFHYDPPRWECYDEALCFERRAMADLERSVEQ